MRRFVISALLPALLVAAAPAGAMKEWRMPPPDETRPEEGCQFPDFPLQSIDGESVWFNDFRGRPLLVAFCSCYTDTSCSVIESLERIRGSHDGNLLTIIVCCETAPALAEDGYARLRQTCADAADLVLIDPLGETIDPFRVDVLPTAYLVDGDFCVRRRIIDVAEMNAPSFHESLRTLMEEYPGP